MGGEWPGLAKCWPRSHLRAAQTGFDEGPFLETLALFERVGETRGSSRALNYLGNIAMVRERYADARSYFENSL